MPIWRIKRNDRSIMNLSEKLKEIVSVKRIVASRLSSVFDDLEISGNIDFCYMN